MNFKINFLLIISVFCFTCNHLSGAVVSDYDGEDTVEYGKNDDSEIKSIDATSWDKKSSQKGGSSGKKQSNSEDKTFYIF